MSDMSGRENTPDLTRIQRTQLALKMFDVRKGKSAEYQTLEDINALKSFQDHTRKYTRNAFILGFATWFALKDYDLTRKVSPSLHYLRTTWLKIRMFPVPKNFAFKFLITSLSVVAYQQYTDDIVQNEYLTIISGLDTKLGKAMRREIHAINPHSKYLNKYPLEQFDSETKKHGDDEE
jgi:hypothetical protein